MTNLSRNEVNAKDRKEKVITYKGEFIMKKSELKIRKESANALNDLQVLSTIYPEVQEALKEDEEDYGPESTPNGYVRSLSQDSQACRVLDDYIKENVYLSSIDLGALVGQNRDVRNSAIPDADKFIKGRKIALIAENIINSDYATDVLAHIVTSFNANKTTGRLALEAFKKFNLNIAWAKDDETLRGKDTLNDKTLYFNSLFIRYLKSYRNMCDRSCRNYKQYKHYKNINIDPAWKPISMVINTEGWGTEIKRLIKKAAVMETLRVLLGFEFLRESAEIPMKDFIINPKGFLSIDRIDSKNGYYLWNLRWADNETQNRNRRCSVFIKIEDKKTHEYDIVDLRQFTQGLFPHKKNLADRTWSRLYSSYRKYGDFDHVVKRDGFKGLNISVAEAKDQTWMRIFEEQNDLKKNK